MKSFFRKASELAASAVEKIETHRPAFQAKLTEVSRETKTQAVAAKNLVQRVIDDERTQGYVSDISVGLKSARENIANATSTAKAHSKTEKSAAPDSLDADQTKISNAIDKLSGRDKVGLSAEALTTAGGAVAGAAAAGTVAGVFGATTLLGSTGLASLLGGVFVTATPVGWVIGSAFLAGAAGYGLAKMVRSGADQDRTRKELVARLSKRLDELQAKSEERNSLIELTQLVSVAMTAGLIDESQGRRLVDLVEKGSLKSTLAVERLRAMALSAGVIVSVDPA